MTPTAPLDAVRVAMKKPSAISGLTNARFRVPVNNEPGTVASHDLNDD